MAAKSSSCFLIDSILEDSKINEENLGATRSYDASSTSLSLATVARTSSLLRSNVKTPDNEALSGRNSTVIDSSREEWNDLCLASPSNPVPQLKSLLTTPFEYFSKLHAMHQALQHGALSSLRHQPCLLPNTNKDFYSYCQMPAFRSGKSECVGRGNPKKYRCDVCDKTFSRSNTLITHKRIHTGEKPFKCDHCGRAFRQPGNLTRHRLTHTTVKPYVCVHCEKAFNRASNLHTHMRTHADK